MFNSNVGKVKCDNKTCPHTFYEYKQKEHDKGKPHELGKRTSDMKRIRICLLLLLTTAMILCATSCGSAGKKAEITFVGITEQKVLNIQYNANRDLSKDDAKIKITVSQDAGSTTGTVYCYSGLKEDLEKGKRYVGLFDMAAERSWTIDGALSLGGSTVTNEVSTADILSFFGEGASVTASFLVGDETVSEMTLEENADQ